MHALSDKSTTVRAKEKLGLMHSDICDPFRVQSLGGEKYFVTFMDDKT